MSTLSWRGRFYNGLSLNLYDVWVIWLNMDYAWGSPTATVLLPLFLSAFSKSRRHLDIGVANGYFPSRAVEHSQQQEKATTKEIVLMDIAENSLMKAKKRIETENPGAAVVTTVLADAMGPAPRELKERKFDSISLFNVLHCIPGPVEDKTRVFRLAADVLEDDGVLVGCTILGYRYLGWRLFGWFTLGLFNVLGALSNWDEGPTVYEQGLHREFGEVETLVHGSILLFRARKPKRSLV